jgi:predicted metal-dependent peptidase
MDTARAKVARFRIACKPAVPYLMHHVYGMVPVETPGIKTMAVDKYGRLYFDPRYVESISEGCGVFSILHEVLHVVLDHCRMAEKHLPKKPTRQQLEDWNIAADAVVNQILSGFVKDAPAGIVDYRKLGLPPKRSVVEYWHILQQRRQEQEEQDEQDEDTPEMEPSDDPDQSGEGDEDMPDMEPSDKEQDDEDMEGDGEDDDVGGESESEGEGDRGADEPDDESGDEGGAGEDSDSGEGDGADHPLDGDDGDGERSGDSDREEGDDANDSSGGEGGGGDDEADEGEADGGGDGAGGSCADGRSRSYELPPDPSYRDREYSLDSELEQAIAEYEASGIGTVPGELKAAVGIRMRPQPDPFDVLRGMVARAIATPVGAPDFTMRRLARKQGDPEGPRLRGVKKETPNCVVILDTSGSMALFGQGSERAAKALDVIGKAVRRLKSVKCVCFDTHLHGRQVVTNARHFKIAGNGGTDMTRAIEQVDKEDRPDAIILITDCETAWPKTKPRARVVVAAVGRCDYYPIPQWARVCDLTKEGGR